MSQREQAFLRGSDTLKGTGNPMFAGGSSIAQGIRHPGCLCLEDNRHL